MRQLWCVCHILLFTFIFSTTLPILLLSAQMPIDLPLFPPENCQIEKDLDRCHIVCSNLSQISPAVFRDHWPNCSSVLAIRGGSHQLPLSLNLSITYFLPSAVGFYEIELSNACIVQLQANFFNLLFGESIHQLAHLSITHNTCLRILPRHAFHQLPSLTVLNLQNNQLTQWDNGGAFDNLPLLSSLLLSFNQLTHIAADSFQHGLGSLLYLDLSHNSIHTIEAGAFAHLDRLKSLGLNHNQLKVLQVGLFQALNLETLNLSSNALQAFDESHVSGTTKESLRYLYLSHNELQSLQEDVLDFDNANPDHMIVELEDNKWICDCNLAWMKRCHQPMELNGATLSNLQVHQLCPRGWPSANQNKGGDFHVYRPWGALLWYIMAFCIVCALLLTGWTMARRSACVKRYLPCPVRAVSVGVQNCSKLGARYSSAVGEAEGEENGLLDTAFYENGSVSGYNEQVPLRPAESVHHVQV